MRNGKLGKISGKKRGDSEGKCREWESGKCGGIIGKKVREMRRREVEK